MRTSSFGGVSSFPWLFTHRSSFSGIYKRAHAHNKLGVYLPTVTEIVDFFADFCIFYFFYSKVRQVEELFSPKMKWRAVISSCSQPPPPNCHPFIFTSLVTPLRLPCVRMEINSHLEPTCVALCNPKLVQPWCKKKMSAEKVNTRLNGSCLIDPLLCT